MIRRTRIRQRGFTLIETVIVLLVFSIITALAVPRFLDALSYHRAEAAVQRITRDLELAKNVARSQSTSQTVVFDTAATAYTLPGVPDFDHPGRDYAVTLGVAPVTVVFDSVNLGGDPQVAFNGFGLPDTTGAIVVRAGKYQRTVTVEADGVITVE